MNRKGVAGLMTMHFRTRTLSIHCATCVKKAKALPKAKLSFSSFGISLHCLILIKSNLQTIQTHNKQTNNKHNKIK